MNDDDDVSLEDILGQSTYDSEFPDLTGSSSTVSPDISDTSLDNPASILTNSNAPAYTSTALDQQGSTASPSSGSLLSSLASLFGIGATAAATQGVLSAQQQAAATLPLQALGITTSTGSLTSTGTMLLLAGAVLVAFSILRK
jgi:hypothetical protein